MASNKAINLSLWNKYVLCNLNNAQLRCIYISYNQILGQFYVRMRSLIMDYFYNFVLLNKYKKFLEIKKIINMFFYL
jgi:hypothetical protein